MARRAVQHQRIALKDAEGTIMIGNALRYTTEELRVGPEDVSFFHYGQELEGALRVHWHRPRWRP